MARKVIKQQPQAKRPTLAFNIGRELAKQHFTLEKFQTFVSWQEYSPVTKRDMLAGFVEART